MEKKDRYLARDLENNEAAKSAAISNCQGAAPTVYPRLRIRVEESTEPSSARLLALYDGGRWKQGSLKAQTILNRKRKTFFLSSCCFLGFSKRRERKVYFKYIRAHLPSR